MRVLTVNPGSSSLKLRLLDDDKLVASSSAPPSDGDDAVDAFVEQHGMPDAMACRIVHGGPRFRSPVVVDDDVEAALESTAKLAPLHNPPALALLHALRVRLPDVPVVACFDTSFHATLPEAAARWALPRKWTDLGVRRYGFHGLAHAWNARRVAELLDRPVDKLRLVSCHLGSGASLCAVDGGHSIDTTMGLTPADGLVMATRGGAIDPGAVTYVIDRLGLEAADAGRLLETEAGLLGLAGNRDQRAVEAAAASGDADAALALAVHDHQLRRHLGAMVAVLGGVDGVVFSGGVGEGSPRTRAAACSGFAFAGIDLDPIRNASCTGAEPVDALLTAPDAAVAVAVVHAREDLEMVRDTRAALARKPPQP